MSRTSDMFSAGAFAVSSACTREEANSIKVPVTRNKIEVCFTFILRATIETERGYVARFATSAVRKCASPIHKSAHFSKFAENTSESQGRCKEARSRRGSVEVLSACKLDMVRPQDPIKRTGRAALCCLAVFMIRYKKHSERIRMFSARR